MGEAKDGGVRRDKTVQMVVMLGDGLNVGHALEG